MAMPVQTAAVKAAHNKTKKLPVANADISRTAGSSKAAARIAGAKIA